MTKTLSNPLAHLAMYIKNQRKQAGISQERLAASTGLSLTLIRDIERQAANPTLSSLIKIADVFGVSVAELIDFNNSLSSPQKLSRAILKELQVLPADKLKLMLTFIRIATK